MTLRLASSRSRRKGGGRLTRVLAAALAVVLGAGAAGVGLLGAATTATVAVLSEDLPDPAGLEDLSFSQPTIVYDRDGKVEIGRFQEERRRVVTFDEVPRLVLDATTTAEDRTFWENPGFDLPAIVAAVAENASGNGERGASTITQQLVRARLLPDEVVGPAADRYMRKAKEILQSMRLNDLYPGEEGKERVVTAYLNEIYYGHEAYGVAAAANTYFGISELADLTPAQAALLAALPKSPSSLDPYRYAEQDEDGRMVVPKDSPPVVRRDWILHSLSTSRWTTLTDAELEQALDEPAVLAGTEPIRFRAGHFTWQVRRQLDALIGDDVVIERAGLRVITTLDWDAQETAQRWVTAATIAPHLKRRAGERLLERLDIPRRDLGWIRALRGKNVRNAALVALDYRTGDVLAYLGSAGYGRNDLASKKFEPKYDAAGDAYRQPGSAFKPVLYAAAFEERALTPGSLLLDITTEFDPRQKWAPRDADRRDRGPVLVRTALQQSLNTPAIRALERTGSKAVAAHAEALGVRFQGGRDAFLAAGLAGALGTVEVRPLDLTSAYGTLANGGVRMPPRMILEIRRADGTVAWQAPEPEGERAVSRQGASLVTDILAGNTNPRVNEAWADALQLRNGPDKSRRPAAAKTGTAQDARDLSTYGYLAQPQGADEPGLVVGIWMGNSDHSLPRRRSPATSLAAAAPLWRAFVHDYTNKWPVATFERPNGIVRATIDAWSGGQTGPWTRATTKEFFIKGTQPGGKREVDQRGLLYSRACGEWRVDPIKAELGPRAWERDVDDWLGRARRGVGIVGRLDSATAYLTGESSWGGRLVGACPQPKPPKPDKGPPDPGNDKPKPPGPPEQPGPPEPPPDDD